MAEPDCDMEHICPDCGGEVTFSADGFVCIEASGIWIGCGWSCTWEEERLGTKEPAYRWPAVAARTQGEEGRGDG